MIYLYPYQYNNTDELDGKPEGQANTLLGTLDTGYLFSYAVFMFASGMLAERVNLRYFLAGGMVASGAITILFGMGKYWNMHNLAFFIAVQVKIYLYKMNTARRIILMSLHIKTSK